MAETPSIRKNDGDGDRMVLNAALSGISYGMGIYSLTIDIKDKPLKKIGFMSGSVLFWSMGFAESFFT
jgi:hypothetical protein